MELKDMRSLKKRVALEKEKWLRQLELQQLEEKSFSDDDRGRKLNNRIANPSNYQKRCRSESPPPKSKRTDKGINKGHPKACSFCRPEICNRFARDASISRYVQELNQGLKNDQYRVDDR
jgi:hypothetical protein